jgi:hypothetical protein
MPADPNETKRKGPGRPAYTTPRVTRLIGFNKDLFDEVQTIIRDPFSGKPKWGSLPQLVNMLLAEWLEKQRKQLGNNHPELDKDLTTGYNDRSKTE